MAKEPTQKEKETKLGPEWRPASTEGRILGLLLGGTLSKSELANRLGHKNISGALKRGVQTLFKKGYVELTIPEKPNSRLQRYRITDKGRRLLSTRNFDEK
jgi:ATP-dependent DNA helicase RecG